MTARWLDGKALAALVRTEVSAGVARFRTEQGRAPGLGLVLVAGDEASERHVRNKQNAAITAGMIARVHSLPGGVDASAWLAIIDGLNADPAIDGILIQLPLPPSLDTAAVLAAVAPAKDVDGLHPENAGALFLGRPRLVAPTARGCMRLLAATGFDVAGQRALVIGRSHIVGRPVAQLLLAANATVTVAHSRSSDLPMLVRQADVLIAAAGSPRLVRGDSIKPGAVVIDVGLSRDEATGKLVGDVASDEALEVASWLTPVPGGVGPMTIACLLQNVLDAARARIASGLVAADGDGGVHSAVPRSAPTA